MKPQIPTTNFRLSVMMFFQYMMFAVWWIPLAAYLANMGLTRNLTALILSSMAFGSVISPMVGMLADRYFRANYLLTFLNGGVAVMLLLAGFTTNPVLLFVFLLITMFFYMPTWALNQLYSHGKCSIRDLCTDKGSRHHWMDHGWHLQCH
jgi:MFS family permease